jgi:hypothetical protein
LGPIAVKVGIPDGVVSLGITHDVAAFAVASNPHLARKDRPRAIRTRAS